MTTQSMGLDSPMGAFAMLPDLGPGCWVPVPSSASLFKD